MNFILITQESYLLSLLFNIISIISIDHLLFSTSNSRRLSIHTYRSSHFHLTFTLSCILTFQLVRMPAEIFKAKSIKRSIKFDDLNQEDKNKLMIQAMKFLIKEKTSQRETYSRITWNEKKYVVDHAIKYLHPIARFEIKRAVNLSELSMSSSSSKSVKLLSNLAITRIFAEIVMNDAKIKKWKERSKTFKIIASAACYMILLNKKNSKAMNYFKVEFDQIISKAHYHFTDAFESKIAKNLIWFTHEMVSVASRKNIALSATKVHLKWKIEKKHQYISDCVRYVRNRKAWEYQLFLFAKKHHEKMNWSTLKDLTQLKNSRFDLIFRATDYRLIVEKKNQAEIQKKNSEKSDDFNNQKSV